MSKVDKIAYDIYMGFAARFNQLIIDNPICQVCNLNPSIRITRWGKVKAACQQCLTKEYNDFAEQTKESDDYDVNY